MFGEGGWSCGAGLLMTEIHHERCKQPHHLGEGRFSSGRLVSNACCFASKIYGMCACEKLSAQVVLGLVVLGLL